MFSAHVGVKDSNEVEVMDILEALQIFSHSFQDRLIVQSDSSIAISWVTTTSDNGPLKFWFYFDEVNSLSSFIQVVFWDAGRLANGMADLVAE